MPCIILKPFHICLSKHHLVVLILTQVPQQDAPQRGAAARHLGYQALCLLEIGFDAVHVPAKLER